ncbi:MAG TPA: hypothetical protein VH186_28210 [Chloroflexia bacterium]|nr:hypothetical protein [Chloroflexia bacterium]
MNEITSANFKEFLDRYYNCDDGVIRSVNINYRSGIKQITVELSVQLRESEQDDDWTNVTLEIENFVEFKLYEGKFTCVVLSEGLHIAFFDGIIYLDFCPYAEPDASSTVEDYRKSYFLIAGKKCYWSQSDYSI